MNSFPIFLFSCALLCLVPLRMQAQEIRPSLAPEYYTPYGVLAFNVESNRIVGTYPHENGRIVGKLDGNELKGSWRQSDGGGEIVITFSPDFSSFKAKYNHTGTPEKWATDWSGMRKPAVQQRDYKTPWGTMKCDFEGSQVSCKYPWFNGKILGELKGREFTGLWLQANGGVGNLRVAFADDFSSFKGTYNDFNFHPEKWNEWSGTASNRKPE